MAEHNDEPQGLPEDPLGALADAVNEALAPAAPISQYLRAVAGQSTPEDYEDQRAFLEHQMSTALSIVDELVSNVAHHMQHDRCSLGPRCVGASTMATVYGGSQRGVSYTLFAALYLLARHRLAGEHVDVD